MRQTGSTAPEFTLPGTDGGEFQRYQLTDFTDAGVVVLAFYPFDFSPVCADELCAFRDAEWLAMTDDVDVLGISTDSCYAHRRLIEEYNLTYPLLSDPKGDVVEEFGVAYDEWELHPGVAKRSVFIVDDSTTIRYAWCVEDAYESPDVEELADEISAIIDVPFGG